MKQFKIYVILIFVVICYLNNNSIAQICYLDEYVEISSVKSESDTYDMVVMKRKDNRVKAKYFAGRDHKGNSAYRRFIEWNKSNPRIILISNGSYLSNFNTPEGLTIDNGIVVNQNLRQYNLDALVIIYDTGGIVASNLKEGDLNIGGFSRPLNIRKSANDLDDFIEWAIANEATVFQTHLLAFDNKLTINQSKSSPAERERRFLCVGKNEDGEVIHSIIFNPAKTSLYNGSKKVINFLNEFRDIEILFMINLDTGMQNVFELNNSDCSINSTSRGWTDPSDSANLLVYYFN